MQIKAKFEFEITSEGRRGPILDGYRPSFTIDGITNSDCCFHLVNSDRINPGECEEVEIHLISPHLVNPLSIGQTFFILEAMKKPVGKGTITEVQ